MTLHKFYLKQYKIKTYYDIVIVIVIEIRLKSNTHFKINGLIR